MRKMLLLAGLLLTGVAVRAQTFTPTRPIKGPDFPRIANCYGSGIGPNTSNAELEKLARYDLIIGGIRCNWRNIREVINVRKKIATLKRINPEIIILEFAASAPYAREDDEGFPADGWLLTSDGAKINGWPGTQMINLTREEVVKWLADRAISSRKRRGYDGAFVDCMAPRFDHWACEIATGREYTVDADGDGTPDDRARLDERWAGAKLEIARAARNGIGDEGILMANQASRKAAQYLNGVLLEDYLDHVIDQGRSWGDVKDEYEWWCENSLKPGITTLVSSSGVEPPFEMWKLPEAEQNRYLDKGRGLTQRMRLGLTTALMGDGYFAYDLHTRARGQHWWYPEYDAELRKPRGRPWYTKEGVWRRRYWGGVVYVNPTIFDVAVTMDHYMRDITSDAVSKAFILPAQDGRIYIQDKGPERKGTIPRPAPLFTWKGSSGVIERDGRLMMRFGGRSAIMNQNGVITHVTHGSRIMMQGISPVIVRDEKWKDFSYEDVTYEKSELEVKFKGERRYQNMRIAFEQSVACEQGDMVLTWNFRSLTPIKVHAFRVSGDLPVGTLRNGTAIHGDKITILPTEISPGPILRGFTEAEFQTENYSSMVGVTLSEPGTLQDERNYGVGAYRIVMPSVSGDLPKGKVWSLSMRIRISRGRRL